MTSEEEPETSEGGAPAASPAPEGSADSPPAAGSDPAPEGKPDTSPPAGGSGQPVHVERDVIFGVGFYRNLLAEEAGMVLDAPPVVVTGCGEQHPIVDTSKAPESVTCPACRAFAAAEHTKQAERAEKAAGWAKEDESLQARINPEELAISAAQHRELAAKYAPLT